YLCGRNCKNDSGRICLEPALTRFGARLLDGCEVLRLEASRSKVTGVVCTHQGEELILRARKYVVAAGALETPRLLLSSVSSAWPNGLANDNGLVGKNLMRHYVDLYALFPGKRVTPTGNVKELAFSDLYLRDGRKLGSVQSFGFLPPAAMLVEEMAQDLQEGPGRWAAAAFKLVKPISRFALKQLFARALVLATTMEDLPYEQNCVMLSNRADDSGRRRLQINYTIRDNEQARIDAFREEMKKILKPYRYMLLKQADRNQRIAHVCGTCRFGLDPRTSVCDANNKAHGLTNLYVSDGSVFPSSGGINPALTIAALSLRLADHIGSTPNE
ncbi:GMC family oxidoreductase, partial [Gammaproteobacteria bacterium]|nr:GMC family oxidoreductase [Gammaproteobacteria bacterium]